MSSRQLTSFSDFRPQADDDFLSATAYLSYLRDYCTHFKLWPFIKLSAPILSVKRRAEGGHVVTYGATLETGHTWECDAIAVCSGLHVAPNIPQIEGIERVPEVFHSSHFKKKEQFGLDKTVMVLGSGETGADIAYMAVTATTKRVILCHKDGFHLAPKVAI